MPPNIRCGCGHGEEYHAKVTKERQCLRCACPGYAPPPYESCDCDIDGTSDNLKTGECYHDRTNRENGYLEAGA